MDGSFADRLQMLSIYALPFLCAIVFHEVAHGAMARRFGDRTAMEAGRLTLNPLPHLDPIGTFLPLAGMLMGAPILFGWARPVPIDPRQFSRLRPGLFMVALAGPLMNFFLAIASAAVYCGARLFIPQDTPAHIFIASAAEASIFINYALGLFNLLPVPPLDGSKIIESILPARAAARFEALSRFGFVILIALLFTGALRFLHQPILIAAESTIRGMARVFQFFYELGLTGF